MYYLILLFILFFFILEIYTKKVYSKAFLLAYLAITCLATFRFGHGNDYYPYESLYNGGLESYVDMGFLFIINVSNKIGIEYMAFSCIFSFIIMALFFPFFQRECQQSFIPLLAFYSYAFLIYPTSAIRQGFALAVACSFLYPLAIRRKYLWFYVVLSLTATIHLSILILAFMPFLDRLKISQWKYWILFGFGTVLIIFNFNFFNFLSINIERGGDYIDENTIPSFFAKLIRIILMFIVLSAAKANMDNKINLLKNYLICGYIVFAFFSYANLIAGRTEVYFRIFEGIYFYYIIRKTNCRKHVNNIAIILFFLYTMLWFKNINSLIEYYESMHYNVNPYYFPYDSIFDIS